MKLVINILINRLTDRLYGIQPVRILMC